MPGASRSGTTITGGLFAGLTRPAAARFSFLLSLPAVFAAGVFQLYKARGELLASSESVTALVISTVVSGIIGYASIAWLLRFVVRHSIVTFVWYRVGLGVLLIVALSAGWLSAT